MKAQIIFDAPVMGLTVSEFQLIRESIGLFSGNQELNLTEILAAMAPAQATEFLGGLMAWRDFLIHAVDDEQKSTIREFNRQVEDQMVNTLYLANFSTDTMSLNRPWRKIRTQLRII